MKHEEDICYLKEVFAERFSYATLTITKRKTRIYFKTVGCHKIEGRHLIECIIGDVEIMSEDLKTLTYKYRGKL